MTEQAITQAIENGDETAGAELIAKVRAARSEDDLAILLADIFAAGRRSAINDIKIDLADWLQTAAVEIIEANY
jgi:hypothetical protein